MDRLHDPARVGGPPATLHSVCDERGRFIARLGVGMNWRLPMSRPPKVALRAIKPSLAERGGKGGAPPGVVTNQIPDLSG